jgi:lysophospholipase L1-like esterase
MKRFTFAAAIVVFACAAYVFAQEAPSVIFDMDTVKHKPLEIENKDKQKMPCGTVELVDGKFGEAVKFTFIDGHGFITAGVRPDLSGGWDEAEGFSFWVKGDGSKSWGGVELVDGDDYKLRYGVCFPIDSTEWTKITVPWRDVIPENPAAPLVDAKTGYKPSSFRNFWFGKWWYWAQYPPCSFTIDQVQLEKKIALDMTDYTPAAPGAARFLAKLKAKQPVTIVTMGDSLSDKKHWANREKLWSEMLVKSLEEKFGGKATLVNPALGGTILSTNLVLMPRWLKDTPKSDLVTVWFGYNDYDSGMRGERFKEMLRLAVDRIRRETKGAADVMLLTTCPANKRWTEMEELAQAVRDVAKEKRTGLADVSAEFHKIAEADEALKLNYWAWDKTHLGAKGHEVARDTVLDAIGNVK